MRNRILPMINLLLILVCAGCIFYLTTRKYEPPAEIAQAEKLLKAAAKDPTPPPPVSGGGVSETNHGAGETNHGPGQVVRQTPGKDLPPAQDTAWIQKEIFPAIWTPTPTPTPTPSPTPAPPDLNSVAVAMEILSIDGNNVEFRDKRKENADPFTMTVGGAPWETVDKDNKPISIKLVSVDQDNARVMVGFGPNTTWVNMF